MSAAGVAKWGDRARPGTRHLAPTVAVEFRVHYRIEFDRVHRFADYEFEHEAVEFAAKVASFPGYELVETPDRPGGIEALRGWDNVSKASAFKIDNTVKYLVERIELDLGDLAYAVENDDSELLCDVLGALSQFVQEQRRPDVRAALSDVIKNTIEANR